jgi:hypothetical protein
MSFSLRLAVARMARTVGSSARMAENPYGTRLPLSSATVRMPPSLRVKNPTRNACAAATMRSSLKPLARPSCTSIALEMPISASPRSTMGTITWSPAVGCTSTFKAAFSLSTFATAEAVV